MDHPTIQGGGLRHPTAMTGCSHVNASKNYYDHPTLALPRGPFIPPILLDQEALSVKEY